MYFLEEAMYCKRTASIRVNKNFSLMKFLENFNRFSLISYKINKAIFSEHIVKTIYNAKGKIHPSRSPADELVYPWKI